MGGDRRESEERWERGTGHVEFQHLLLINVTTGCSDIAGGVA